MNRRGAGTYASALAHRRFRQALTGHALAGVASGVRTVAIATLLFQLTGSVGWVAAGSVCRLAPFLVFSPAAGVLADRFGPLHVLRVSSALRIATAAGLAVVAATGAPPLAILAVALVATTCTTPAYASVSALVPRSVPAVDLAAATSLIATAETAGWVVGPAAGGIALVALSPAVTIAASAVLSAIAFAALPRHAGPDLTAVVAEAPVGSFLAELASGLRTILDSGPVRAAVLLVVLANALDGVATVMLVLVAAQRLGLHDSGYGLLTAALGAGALGAVVINRRLAAGHQPLAEMAAALLVGGGCFAALAAVDVPAVAVLLLVGYGGSFVVAEVVATTLLQRALDPARTARVFGVLDSLLVGSMLVGSLLAPALNAAAGLDATLVLTGLGVPLFALAGFPGLLRAERAAARRTRALQPTIDLLAGLPILRHSSRPAVDVLAAASRRFVVPIGATVIREGDEPDDFYAVATGTFDVFENDLEGRPVLVNRVGAGDGFGEIGLLAGVPRTATVTASSTAELVRIPGQAFVAAMKGSPIAPAVGAMSAIVGRATPALGERESGPPYADDGVSGPL